MGSTGWRTEILILIGLLLGLALLSDLAGRFEMGHLGTTATAIGGLLAQVLAIFTARARQGAVNDLKAQVGGDDGA